MNLEMYHLPGQAEVISLYIEQIKLTISIYQIFIVIVDSICKCRIAKFLRVNPGIGIIMGTSEVSQEVESCVLLVSE